MPGPEEQTPVEETPQGDVTMTEDSGNAETESALLAFLAGERDAEGEAEAPAAEAEAEKSEEPKLVLFADLIKSPLYEVIVGDPSNRTTYTAHEAVLAKAPHFASTIKAMGPEDPRKITIEDADHDAMGSCLEYLYTGEYFPKKTSSARDAPLEKDPRHVSSDDAGAGLLVHARVYTLAGRLGLDTLKSIAHSKIHRTPSTAKGELAYARYVYKESTPDDATIRKPIAAFWATRSYSLRHEAEPEFKSMCLEFPQFSYDVLQLVLDQQEKSRKGSSAVATSEDTPASPALRNPAVVPGSSRKRARGI